MKLGLWFAMIGALLFAFALTVLPWQTFEIARVEASALDLGGFGVAMLVLALGASGVAGWGLATGRRKPASQLVLGAGLGLVIGLVVARANAQMGFDLMPFESVRAGVGSGLGLLAGAFVVVGGLITRQTLPTWDESSPLLRIAVLGPKGGGARAVVADAIVYEPGTVRVRELLGAMARGLAELPMLTVTPEGDVRLGLPPGARLRMTRGGLPMAAGGRVDGRADGRVAGRVDGRVDGRVAGRVGGNVALKVGDQAVITVGELEIMCGHVTPSGEVGGRVAAMTLARSEVWSFSGAAAIALLGLFVAPLMAWTEAARIAPFCEVGLCAGVMPEIEAEKPETLEAEVILPDAIEVEPERSSKAVGGPEGRFGDPTVTAPRVTIVPRVDAPLIGKVDPSRIGLNALIDRELATTSSIADVFRGDVAATTDRIAAAMDGDGSTLVLGPGRGLGFQGDEGGGPGDDGLGRILAQGEIDDGPGGPGIRTSLGKPPKRKVGVMDNGPHSQSGYCSAANIATVVKRRAGAIRACYEKSLQVNNGLAGKVTVRWTIGEGGKVTTAAAVGDTLGDAGTTRCILDWVRRMGFEAPEGGMCVVQWPFAFSAGN